MNTQLVHLSLVGSEPVSVIVSRDMTLDDAILRANLIDDDLSDYKITAFYKGKAINQFTSFQANNIPSNAHIIILTKRRMNDNDNFFFNITDEEREEIIDDDVISEKCRLADLGFQGWECDPRFNDVIKEVYESEVEELEDDDAFLSRGTVISKTKEICDQPLPRCFLLGDF